MANTFKLSRFLPASATLTVCLTGCTAYKNITTSPYVVDSRVVGLRLEKTPTPLPPDTELNLPPGTIVQVTEVKELHFPGSIWGARTPDTQVVGVVENGPSKGRKLILEQGMVPLQFGFQPFGFQAIPSDVHTLADLAVLKAWEAKTPTPELLKHLFADDTHPPYALMNRLALVIARRAGRGEPDAIDALTSLVAPGQTRARPYYVGVYMINLVNYRLEQGGRFPEPYLLPRSPSPIRPWIEPTATSSSPASSTPPSPPQPAPPESSP